MAQWQSLYMRTDLDDTGEYPRELVQTSPDLIDWGVKPAEDPSGLITDKAWSEYVGGRTVPKEQNYLYVRGRNLSAKAVSEAEIRLYCAPVSLVLWPNLPDKTGWADNPLKTPSGTTSQYVDVRGMGLWVTPEPFLREPPAGAGLSLVGWLTSKNARNVIPETQDIIKLATYLHEHPDTSAFHLQPPPEHPEPGVAWETALGFYQGMTATEIMFEVVVRNGRPGDRFELGSKVLGGGEPDPPVRAAWPIKNSIEDFMFRTQVPAEWNAQLILKYLPNAADPGVPADLDVQAIAYAVIDVRDPLAAYAATLPRVGRPHAHLPADKQAFPVGSVRYEPEAPVVP